MHIVARRDLVNVCDKKVNSVRTAVDVFTVVNILIQLCWCFSPSWLYCLKVNSFSTTGLIRLQYVKGFLLKVLRYIYILLRGA